MATLTIGLQLQIIFSKRKLAHQPPERKCSCLKQIVCKEATVLFLRDICPDHVLYSGQAVQGYMHMAIRNIDN